MSESPDVIQHMGWFGSGQAKALRAQVDQFNVLPPAPVAANTIGLDQIPGLVGGWMSRESARLVPSFARGLDLITGVASGFPLTERSATGEPLQPLGFTARPSYEPGIPRVVTIRRTIADLVCEGKAYWVIDEALAGGYPAAVQRVDPLNVTPQSADELDPNTGLVKRVDYYLVNGHRFEAADVIVFDSGTDGALHSGWFALRTAIELEATASRYALTPLPQIALRSTGIDLLPDQAEELLGSWDTARRTRGTAYLNSGVETVTYGWSSSELQLVEARQHSAIEVARLLNLDPVWVGSSPAGSSLTYTNRQDQNQQLLDNTILPLLRVIEQRLSMLTVNRVFMFDSVAFLRANLGERVTAITSYLDAGVITVEEARTLEPMIRKGGGPSSELV